MVGNKTVKDEINNKVHEPSNMVTETIKKCEKYRNKR